MVDDKEMKIYPTETRIKPFCQYLIDNYKNGNLIGCEIGVQWGYNSLSMLSSLPNLKTLYMVDPSRESIVDHTILNNQLYKDRSVFIKKLSDNAVDDVPNNLDFIYIDGDHTYNAVVNDIQNYYPKLRKGGLFGGDDYNNHKAIPKFEVTKAVDEFVLSKKYDLTVSKYWQHTNRKEHHGYKENCEWWVIKNE